MSRIEIEGDVTPEPLESTHREIVGSTIPTLPGGQQIGPPTSNVPPPPVVMIPTLPGGQQIGPPRQSYVPQAPAQKPLGYTSGSSPAPIYGPPPPAVHTAAPAPFRPAAPAPTPPVPAPASSSAPVNAFPVMPVVNPPLAVSQPKATFTPGGGGGGGGSKSDVQSSASSTSALETADMADPNAHPVAAPSQPVSVPLVITGTVIGILVVFGIASAISKGK